MQTERSGSHECRALGFHRYLKKSRWKALRILGLDLLHHLDWKIGLTIKRSALRSTMLFDPGTYWQSVTTVLADLLSFELWPLRWHSDVRLRTFTYLVSSVEQVR